MPPRHRWPGGVGRWVFDGLLAPLAEAALFLPVPFEEDQGNTD